MQTLRAKAKGSGEPRVNCSHPTWSLLMPSCCFSPPPPQRLRNTAASSPCPPARSRQPGSWSSSSARATRPQSSFATGSRRTTCSCSETSWVQLPTRRPPPFHSFHRVCVQATAERRDITPSTQVLPASGGVDVQLQATSPQWRSSLRRSLTFA